MTTGFEQILVPFHNNQQWISAMPYASMLASGTKASIIGLHLTKYTDHTNVVEGGLMDKKITEQLWPELLKIQGKYPAVKKLSIHTLRQTKAAHKHILEYAHENNMDCIVMRNHDQTHPGSSETDLCKTQAYYVGLESECPVFTFKQSSESAQMKNILLPLDLSHGSLYKVPVASGLALRYGARIHLLSASEHKEDLDEIEQQMVEVKKRLKIKGIQVQESDVQQDTSSDAIARYCEKHRIDLIVIMSRPAFRWSDKWMSPSARKVMTRSKVPVLSVRTDQPMFWQNYYQNTLNITEMLSDQLTSSRLKK